MRRISLPKPQLTPHTTTGEAQRRLVLYVEDDVTNQEVARARLAKDYELIIASDDRAACDALVRYGRKLALILMDIELKGSRLSGVDLASLVRGRLDSRRIPPYAASVPKLELPIIFVTAYGKNYPRADLLLSGGGEVIDKPINFVQLHTAMAREYLGKRA